MSTIAMSQQQNSVQNGANQQNADQNNPGNSLIQNALQSLLCKEPFPISELDELILKLNTGNAQERKIAQEILICFKKDENSWNKVDGIIENTQQQETKYFALQILEHTISTSWKILPREQCEAIKNFAIQIIIDLCKSIENMKQQKLYLSKLNLVLVKIIKQDWPLHWPTALGDIVGAAKQSEPLCQNNLEVLRILSEEIFIFGENEMVQSKIKNLKGAMNEEFGKVFELCYYVLENSDNEELVSTCLKTLLKFISWIPGHAFFNTNLIEKLTTRLLPYQGFRNDTLACLTEIIEKSIHSKSDNFFNNDPQGANLQRPNVEQKTLQLYAKTFTVVNNFIPADCDLKSAFKDGADHDQTFIQNLAIFLTSFGKNCQTLVEQKHEYRANEDSTILQNFVSGLNFMVKISYIDDVEVFKTCLEFWCDFSNRVYASLPMANQAGMAGWGQWGTEGYTGPYQQVLKDVRLMMICKMARPEEILVGTNEQGEVVRTKMQDTANVLLYNTCRQTLVFLTHIDTKDMEEVMVRKLQRQVDTTANSEWDWNRLQKLCWSIGSISGSMKEDDERKFLVHVIKDLLGLCEQKRGKDNKAIIAACIMYVVGQYPRFLKNHWKFLKTVVNKLFEFMHEQHDGVQDMACDTFSKIAQQCKGHFVEVRDNEAKPFILEILDRIQDHIYDLHKHQQQHFYEAVGHMITAEKNSDYQQQLIAKYMMLPNQIWQRLLMENTQSNGQVFNNQDQLRTIIHILRTNNRACSAIGHSYIHQLGHIFGEMIDMYTILSQKIMERCQGNVNLLGDETVRDMRTVKKEIILLINEWISKCKSPQILMENMADNLMKATLLDYKNSMPQARDPEVINCIVAITAQLGENINKYIMDIFQHIFEPTIAMIRYNETEFPEHRTNFFKFLSAINEHAFRSMLGMSQDQFSLVLQAIIWGMRQLMQECKETSVGILDALLSNVEDQDLLPHEDAQMFYKRHYIEILEHVFEVSTDTLHANATLKEHSLLLSKMISIVCSTTTVRTQGNTVLPKISIPLGETTNNQPFDNKQFTYNHIRNLLHNQFGDKVTAEQITVFVEGLFVLHDVNEKTKVNHEFISHVRDFLIQMKEKRGEDTADLFLEERMREIKSKKESRDKEKIKVLQNVPGMFNPYHTDEREIDQLKAFAAGGGKNDQIM